MAKAKLTLPNGTVVEIEGTPEEVNQLLRFYSQESGSGSGRQAKPMAKAKAKAKPRPTKSTTEPGVNIAEIVNHVKNSDEAEIIETRILDKTSMVNRVLLPFYIVHQYMDNAYGLSSGDINRVTTDLGIPVSTPNASRALSGTAAKYVMGDTVRKMGRKVLYKLTRRGLQYMQEVLSASSGE